MESLSTLFRRYYIFNKRLFKKPSFLIILLLVPMLIFSLNIVSANEDSGIMTIALAKEDNEDPLATEIVDSLRKSRSLIRFIPCETINEASTLVEKGKADAAWIFPEKMQEKIDKFTDLIHGRNAFVKLIEKESNVFMLLAHEKLTSVLYPYCSFSLYKDFVRDNIIALDILSDAELQEYYHAIEAEGADIFQFSYLDSNESAENRLTDYLLTPLRGLMSALIMLGGFAVAMFYMQDEANKKFDWIKSGKRFPFAIGYHMTAVLNMGIIVLIALFVTNMNVSLARELISMALYIIITVGFCMAVRLICRDIRIFGAVIPALLIGMIALSPVFFDIKNLPFLQYLLPTYYYLNSIYNINFLYSMILYAVLIYGFDYLMYRIKTR